MSDSQHTAGGNVPSSLFKLRLTTPLRQRLEAQALSRGLTLTGEILRRIDESFSDASERLTTLEKYGKEQDRRLREMEERIHDLEKEGDNAMKSND
ncbi:hypothetical protein [Asaia spathodeae]|uniref:Uncharacterized protein n=1 Tax=Asaia spathodeae TaxID=657016 RepID=A0ABX2P965_9PROT|nr:hypothetical protein [Asaia spathodeae]GBR16808.1 hypothetical protein AA105894_1663 [Asaia spathodeae NBRC 105894]